MGNQTTGRKREPEKKKKMEAVKIENLPKLMPDSQYMIPALQYSKIGTIMETVKKIISFQELEEKKE